MKVRHVALQLEVTVELCVINTMFIPPSSSKGQSNLHTAFFILAPSVHRARLVKIC